MKEKIITDATFQQAENGETPRFVEFFATWCPHCQRMMPIIAELQKEYKDRVDFFLVDVDQAPQACEKYDISSTPTMFFYKKNQAEYNDEVTGECSARDMRERLDKIV
ncbi:MAG: thioredoxin family protein [Elusimicrobiota bacterium]|jgi:thioredoxin 1|nr:thioredoxin family protein [Elusimicrobiota bacterium]